MIKFIVRHAHSIGLPNCHHARKTVLNKGLMNIILRLPGLESRDAGPCRHDRRFWDLSCCVNTWDASTYEHFLATQMQLRHMRQGQGHRDSSRTTSTSRRWHASPACRVILRDSARKKALFNYLVRSLRSLITL